MKIKTTVTINRTSLQRMGMILTLFFMFLAAMNFMQKAFYWVFAAFFAWMLTSRGKLRCDVPFGALVILAFSMVLFAPTDELGLNTLLRPFSFLLAYVLGQGIVDGYRKDATRREMADWVIRVLWVLVMGLVVHIALNYSLNVGSVYRNTVDYWTQTNMSATGQAALCCLPVAVASAHLFIDCSKKVKVLSLAVLALVFAYNLLLAGRTVILYIAICFLVGVVYSLTQRDVSQGSKQKVLFAAAALVVVCLCAYGMNVFHIQEIVQDSNLYQRFFGARAQSMWDTYRIQYKELYFDHLLEHLWGGSEIRGMVGSYAHDLYLDTYDYYGIFAYVSVVVYSVCSVFHLIRCVFSQGIPWQLRQVMLTVYVVFHIEFLLEPILIGMLWFMMVFCFIDGMLIAYLRRAKERA